MPRVGLLANGSPADPLNKRYTKGFEDRLRQLGWIEGTNITYERRWASGDGALRQRFARELVESRADVIFATSEPVAEAARQATSAIPIVSAVLVNPIERGLIASYAHPGGNVTGMAWDQSIELTEKYPELLREAVPGLTGA